MLAFVLLVGIAMALYPGGTWLDPLAPGHDFFRNFFCDLTAPKALNGQQNPGVVFARSGMMMLTLGIFPFWLLVTRLFAHARARWANVVFVLGVLSTSAAMLVPLVSSQEYGFLHPLLILVAGVPGLFAGGLAAFALAMTKSAPRMPAMLAIATVLFVSVDGALYAAHVISGQAISSAWLPSLQKLAAMSLVAWMLATAVAHFKAPCRTS